jgi:hypothetical protein
METEAHPAALPWNAAASPSSVMKSRRFNVAIMLTAASGTKRTFHASRQMSVLGEKAVVQRTSPQ